VKSTKIEVQIRHNGQAYFGFFRHGEYGDEIGAMSVEQLDEKIKIDCKKYCQLDNITIEHTYDVTAVFEEFDFINKTGFARFIDINPSLIRQYASGVKNPSKKQMTKILNGFFKIANQMNKIALAVDGKPLIDSD
jgi:hypothetical protein